MDYSTRRNDLASEELGFKLEELFGQPLDFFAREGARILLEVALEQEVSEFLDRGRYERKSDAPRGYRNGKKRRIVQCGSGEVEVRRPKVTGAEREFRSQVREIIPNSYRGACKGAFGLPDILSVS